ncbi:MAG: hypothetical protein ABJL11_03715 [Parasphingorhabdus sp.]
MIAGVALLAGGIFILRKGTNRKQGILMLIASAVMFGNLAIWLAPVPEGSDPIESR